ncbi:protein RAE1-like isoform X2 [Carex rostrata]
MAFSSLITTNVNNPNKSFEVLPAPSDSVSSLSFSPRANHLVATSWDNQVRCWEVLPGSSQPKASISHDQPVLCSTWKDDGTTVFTGGCDKQVKMWPLLSGGPPTTVAMHDAPVKEIAWISQMNLLVSGSWDKTLRYWDTRQAQPAHVQPLPERCYAITVNYPLMVVGTADRQLIVYNLQNPQAGLVYTTWTTPNRARILHLNATERELVALRFILSTLSTSTLCITHLPLLGLMVLSTFGIRTVNRDSRLSPGVLILFHAVLSMLMVQSMHMQFVMTGAKVLKIIIQRLQRHISTCTAHRNLR